MEQNIVGDHARFGVVVEWEEICRGGEWKVVWPEVESGGDLARREIARWLGARKIVNCKGLIKYKINYFGKNMSYCYLVHVLLLSTLSTVGRFFQP